MRFLLVSTDYPAFLSSLYTRNPGLSDASYEKQQQVRAESLFSLADFYSSNLRKLGHDAWDVDVNNEFIQKAWAREHGLRVDGDGRVSFTTRHCAMGFSSQRSLVLRYPCGPDQALQAGCSSESRDRFKQ